MKLRNYLETSRDYTDKASNISRQLNFAGIGIVGLILFFNKSAGINNSIILLTLISISISLFTDFLQYAVGAFLWKNFYLNKINKGIKPDANVDFEEEDEWRKNRINIFYYVKFIFLVISYLLIIGLLVGYIIGNGFRLNII
jgi:hypothetical protein